MSLNRESISFPEEIPISPDTKKTCSGYSAGVILWNANPFPQIGLVARKKYPYGLTILSEHMEQQGDANDLLETAIRGTREEIGQQITKEDLSLVANGNVPYVCRKNGSSHQMSLFQLLVSPSVTLSYGSEEVERVVWHSVDALADLIEQSRNYFTFQSPLHGAPTAQLLQQQAWCDLFIQSAFRNYLETTTDYLRQRGTLPQVTSVIQL